MPIWSRQLVNSPANDLTPHQADKFAGVKFNGVPEAQFGLYLKECEWRFNNSDPQGNRVKDYALMRFAR